MPEITPIAKDNQISITANTVTPSQLLRTPSPRVEAPPKEEVLAEDPEKKQKDEKVLKARLLQERLKRNLELEKKKLAEEKRQFEIERASTRKWSEANELIAQGKYLEAANHVGLSYEQLTNQILNNGQLPPAEVAKRSADELVEKKFAEYKKQQEENQKIQQKEAYDNAMKDIEREVKYLVDKDNKYELAKASESYHDIVKLIESEYHRTGRIIPVEEAIEKWEADALQGLEELAKLEKVRSRVLKESPKAPQEEERRVPTTLSQRTMAPVPAPKGLTAEERRQRAIDAFYGRLP